MQFQIISCKTLDTLLKKSNYLLIDLREKQDYEISHIPNAIWYNWEKLEKEKAALDVEQLQINLNGKDIGKSSKLFDVEKEIKDDKNVRTEKSEERKQSPEFIEDPLFKKQEEQKEDKTKEVFSKGRELEKIGLRVPQITKIMLELREKGFNVPEGILTVDEAMDCISSLLDKEGKIW